MLVEVRGKERSLGTDDKKKIEGREYEEKEEERTSEERKNQSVICGGKRRGEERDEG